MSSTEFTVDPKKTLNTFYLPLLQTLNLLKTDSNTDTSLERFHPFCGQRY